MWNPDPRDRAEKIGYLLFRATMMAINTVLLFIVAMLVAIAFDTGHMPSRETVLVIITAAVAWRFRSVVFFSLLAPDAPSHRMVNLTDAEARSLYRDIKWALGISIVTISLCDWMKRLDLDADAHKLSLIVSMFIGVAADCLPGAPAPGVALRNMVLGAGDPATKPLWRRAIAAIATKRRSPMC